MFDRIKKYREQKQLERTINHALNQKIIAKHEHTYRRIVTTMWESNVIEVTKTCIVCGYTKKSYQTLY